MDDVETSTMTRLDKRWFASLALDFSLQRERTTLVGKRHTGPLVVQKMLYPEGDKVCHGIIIHPPGGVAGGDQLLLQSSLKQGAQALLTTPGAGKWYKANGQAASQQLKFDLEPGASLEWLPQENILFDGSSVGFSAEIALQGDAVFCGWEILCFGRQARGEAWSEGELQQGLSIRRDQRLIWNERMFLHPQSRALKSVAGLRGFPVSASLVVAAGTVPADVLEACRMIEADQESQYGVTALPEIFSARYIGSSSEAAKQYFERLWQLLRPWYAGRAAVRPRIWNT